MWVVTLLCVGSLTHLALQSLYNVWIEIEKIADFIIILFLFTLHHGVYDVFCIYSENHRHVYKARCMFFSMCYYLFHNCIASLSWLLGPEKPKPFEMQGVIIINAILDWNLIFLRLSCLVLYKLLLWFYPNNLKFGHNNLDTFNTYSCAILWFLIIIQFIYIITIYYIYTVSIEFCKHLN